MRTALILGAVAAIAVGCTTNPYTGEKRPARAVTSGAAGAAAGAASGFLARALLQPFDVLKIRMQLAVTRSAGAHPTLLETVAELARHEGVYGMWKGHVPAQLLSVGYGAVQFAVYARACDLAGVDASRKKSVGGGVFSVNFVLGGVAGMAATAACHPLDTVRTRVVFDRARVGIASGRVGVHGATHDASQGLGDTLQRQRGGGVRGDQLVHRVDVGEGVLGEQLAEDHPQRVDVRARVAHVEPEQLFGGRVEGRPELRVAARQILDALPRPARSRTGRAERARRRARSRA